MNTTMKKLIALRPAARSRHRTRPHRRPLLDPARRLGHRGEGLEVRATAAANREGERAMRYQTHSSARLAALSFRLMLSQSQGTRDKGALQTIKATYPAEHWFVAEFEALVRNAYPPF